MATLLLHSFSISFVRSSHSLSWAQLYERLANSNVRSGKSDPTLSLSHCYLQTFSRQWSAGRVCPQCRGSRSFLSPVQSRQQIPALGGQPVFLLTACGLVGDGHFQPAHLQQRLEHLVPELGAVSSAKSLHQVGNCLFQQAVTKNYNLVPTWSPTCSTGRPKVVVTHASDTSITGCATPCSRDRSRKRRARGFVEIDQPLGAEKLANLLARQLLAVRSLAHEELAAKGIGFVVLNGHCNAQHASYGRHFKLDRRFRGTSNGLDLGSQLAVIRHANDIALVRDTEQDDAPGGVGKGAYLRPRSDGMERLNSDVHP